MDESGHHHALHWGVLLQISQQLFHGRRVRPVRPAGQGAAHAVGLYL